MSAFNLLRRSALAAPRSSIRRASTMTTKPHEPLSKFIPTEVYPLIGLVTVVCSYGLGCAYQTFGKGDLRLLPARFQAPEVKAKEVWED